MGIAVFVVVYISVLKVKDPVLRMHGFANLIRVFLAKFLLSTRNAQHSDQGLCEVSETGIN